MAREFKMGARLTLKDDFSKRITSTVKATERFKKSTDAINKSMKQTHDHSAHVASGMSGMGHAMNKAAGHADHMKHSFGSMYKDMMIMSGVMAAVTATLAAPVLGFKWMVSANSDMETFKNTLQVVLKDEKKAIEMLAWAQDFAVKTPFEIPQVVEASTLLSAYGLNAQKTLGIVGDMAGVMGKDLLMAVNAVADATTGETERLKEFGITKKHIEQQAKLMKLNAMNKKGEILDQKAFNAALLTLMEKRFKGGMELQSKTFKGIISNIKDFIGTTGRELGKPLFDKLKDQLSNVLVYLQKLKDDGTLANWINNIQTKVTSFTATVVKLWPYIRDWGPVILSLVAAYAAYHKTVAIVTAATKAWNIVQKILNGTMKLNPIGLWVAAIVALVGIFIWAWNKFPKFREAVTQLVTGAWESLKFIGKVIMDTGWAIVNFFTGLGTDLFNSGKAIITTIVDGIKAVADNPVKAIKDIFAKVRKLLPFSDAKEGPFSNLTLNGSRIMTTLAKGVDKQAGTLHKAVSNAFSKTPVSFKANAIGPAYMNERGGELAILPDGNQITPADKTDEALSNTGSIIIQNLIGKLEINKQSGEDDENFAYRIVDILYERLRNASEIANNDEMGVLVNG